MTSPTRRAHRSRASCMPVSRSVSDDRGAPACDLAVVVPVHNRSDSLWRAVSSVVRQARPGVRVVVVDDGSEPMVDPSMLADPSVELVRVPHGGVSRARNAGVAAAADARWVTFLDSDDEALDGWVDAILGAADGGAALFSCAAEYRWNDGGTKTVVPLPLWRASAAPRGVFLAGTFALPRALFLEAGGYRPGLRHGENTDLGWRVAAALRDRAAPTISVERALVLVHAVRKPHDSVVLLESAQTVLADPPEMLLEDRRTHGSYFAIAGVEASRLGQRRTAVSMLAKAVRTNPWELRHVARLIRAAIARRRP